MAQGTGKLKAKSNKGIKKEKHRQKKQQLKKGARVIAPKKTKHVEAGKLKKGLEKAIKANIEQEISLTVQSVEPKSFHVVKTPAGDPATSKKDSKQNVKLKKK